MTASYTMKPGNFLEGTIRSVKVTTTAGTEGADQLPAGAVGVTGKISPVAGLSLAGLGSVDVVFNTLNGVDLTSGGSLLAYAWSLARETWVRWPEMDLTVNDGLSSQHWTKTVASRDWLLLLPSGLSAAGYITLAGSLAIRR